MFSLGDIFRWIVKLIFHLKNITKQLVLIVVTNYLYLTLEKIKYVE